VHRRRLPQAARTTSSQIDTPIMSEDEINLQSKDVDENGNEVWKTVGSIRSMDTTQSDSAFKKDLSIGIKMILSPNARIKAHRRANYLYSHSSDKVDTNLLILLHGAGDSHVPYHKLAKKMNLHQTAILSIHSSAFGEGFVKLPFNLGYTWFNQMNYKNGEVLSSNDQELIVSLEKAVLKINLLIDSLIEDGLLAERIFLFGFSAGASLVMHVCTHRLKNGVLPLGGAICVAGGLIHYDDTLNRRNQEQKMATKLLVLGGTDDETFNIATAKTAVSEYNKYAGFAAAELVIRKGKKHEMISSESDMREVFRFLGQNLVRRTIQMEGYCEIK
jgi:predicted esterase